MNKRSAPARRYAVFDIDGTLIRWQLYHAVNDALVKAGAIDQNVFKKVRNARMNWKKRTGEDSFKEYEKLLVEVFDASLGQLSVAEFAAAVDLVFDEYKDQVYTYTRDLIHKLKRDDYLLFAISGSPAIIIEKLARYYGFDDYAATSYPTKNGRFTGAKDLSLGKKPALLKALIEKHGSDFTDSVGVGDSEGDIDMLEMTSRPIAFNPSRKLFQHASRRKWKIIVERKNMIYELEAKDGSYTLV